MDFSLTDEQRMLRRTIRDLVGGHPSWRRNMIADELIKRGFPSWI